MGEYSQTRVWEFNLMLSLTQTPKEYSRIEKRTRTRMICARNIDGWIKALDEDNYYRNRPK